MAQKEEYLYFCEYIRQGESTQRERAEAWSVAIGLQSVDSQRASDYLRETAYDFSYRISWYWNKNNGTFFQNFYEPPNYISSL